jgi:hypothetical protein
MAWPVDKAGKVDHLVVRQVGRQGGNQAKLSQRHAIQFWQNISIQTAVLTSHVIVTISGRQKNMSTVHYFNLNCTKPPYKQWKVQNFLY